MRKMIIVKAYDGTLVRIDENDLEEFNERTRKIKALLSEGKTKEEALKMLNEDKKN